MAISPVSFSKSDKNPIGMIASSMLTEAQFQAENGTGWILADGRNIAGSRYAAITGTSTVPDLRGMVLRGKNNGRADGNQDPGGERALGNFQDHAFTSHTHTTGLPGATASGGNPNHYPGNSAWGTGNFASGGPSTGSGNETRMRNMAVNHFIKINP